MEVLRRRCRVGLLVGLGLGLVGTVAHAQNTIGGDEFEPGEADFPQSGSQVGTGPAFQFSDEFYTDFGIDAEEIRRQENDATGPSRFGAFYRGYDSNGDPDAGIAPGIAPDDRFLDDTRHTVHNMGFNAAGEMLFYPDPLAFFFESAFLNEETKELANISFVYGFPRTVDQPNPIPGCETAAFTGDLLNPAPCGRRQDNIFDTGNGYLTSNPLQLWRIVFVTWDGPDVDTPECQEEMARLADKNGLDLDGTPILKTVREVLDVAGPDLIAGQGADEMVLADAHPGAHGLPNPDKRNDIPGVEPEERGQVCVNVRTRRQVDQFGNLAQPDDPLTEANEALDGAPWVV